MVNLWVLMQPNELEESEPGDSTNTRRADELLLIGRAKSGDSQAFERLFNRHALWIQREIRSIIPNKLDIEDAIEETRLRAWNNVQKLEPNKVGGWLKRIAINVAFDNVRKARSEIPLLDVIEYSSRDGRYDPEATILNEEFRTKLDTAIESLSPKTRLVAQCIYREQLTPQETAELLSWPLPVVFYHRTKARSEISRFLVKERIILR